MLDTGKTAGQRTSGSATGDTSIQKSTVAKAACLRPATGDSQHAHAGRCVRASKTQAELASEQETSIWKDPRPELGTGCRYRVLIPDELQFHAKSIFQQKSTSVVAMEKNANHVFTNRDGKQGSY